LSKEESSAWAEGKVGGIRVGGWGEFCPLI